MGVKNSYKCVLKLWTTLHCERKNTREDIPFVNKTSKNAHMKRQSLRNKYFQNSSQSYKIAHNRKRNYCEATL